MSKHLAGAFIDVRCRRPGTPDDDARRAVSGRQVMVAA